MADIFDLPDNLSRKSLEKMTEAMYNPDKFFHHKQTNADRIRQMSDEELADMLDHVQGDAFLVGIGERKNSVYPGAGISWLDWLKQEVEDGDTDT